MFDRSHNRKSDTFPRVCVVLLALSVPPVLWLWDLPPETFAGCATYGYACTEVACFGVEISTDYGYTWRDDSVYIYGSPQSAVYLYVRTVLGVLWGDVEGWSFGVRHDGSALEAAGGELTLNAAGAGQIDTVKCGYPPDFQDTQIRPCGYTQGVVIDYGSTGCTVSAPRLLVTSYACYRVVMPPTEGVYPVTLKLTDDVGDPPIDSMVVQGGQSKVPCKLDLTLNVYSTSSYYPTPSYCTLYLETPLACAQGGGGGGQGAGGGVVVATERIPVILDEAGQPTTAEPDDESRDARITPDGRFVTFASKAGNLVGGLILPTPRPFQVYRYDRETLVTDHVSTKTNGLLADDNCVHPSISDDGQVIAFTSFSGLDPQGDPDALPPLNPAEERRADVYLWESGVPGPTLLSRDTNGMASGVDSCLPSISGDGRFVLFTSEAEDLDPSVTSPELLSVYRCDLTTLALEFASRLPPSESTVDLVLGDPVQAVTGQVYGFSPWNEERLERAEITEGSVSDVLNTTGDLGVFQDGPPFSGDNDSIFMRDFLSSPPVTVRANELLEDSPPFGQPLNFFHFFYPTVSADASRVAYCRIRVFTEDPVIPGGPAVPTSSEGQVEIEDVDANRWIDPTGGFVIDASTFVQHTKLSDDGSLVVYTQNDPPDGHRCDVLIANVRTAFVRVESFTPAGGEPNGDSLDPDLALLGEQSIVVFESDASDLVAGDTNGKRDLFVRLDQSGSLQTFVRGDSDANGTINLSDAVVVLNYLFRGGALACRDAGDTDDNGVLNLTDQVALLRFLFRGGAPPQPPTPSATTYVTADCLADPTADTLGCAVMSVTCH